jgi:putative chitinase
MTDWVNIIQSLSRHAKHEYVIGLAAAMPKIIDEFSINTPLRQAHFLAQCLHESDGLHTTEEYASGAAYERRADLGNTKPGDGRRFKGRGIIQLTGRANYARASADLHIDFVNNPKLAGEAPWCYITAGLFWNWKGLNRYADDDDIETITRKINGGYNGLEDRKGYLRRAKCVLGVGAALGFAALDDDAGAELPKGKIKAAQTRLRELGYFNVGAIDGELGSATVAALVQFQKDENIAATGTLDADTDNALWEKDERPLPASRREATADDLRAKGSETIAEADGVASGALKVGGTGLAVAASGGMDTLSNALGFGSRVKDVVEDGGGFLSWMQSHALQFAAIVAGAALLYIAIRDLYPRAKKIIEARLKDHRTGANMGR